MVALRNLVVVHTITPAGNPFQVFNLFNQPPPHNGRKSLILAPQEIPDISGYQWGFGCQFVKAYITENPVRNQKIL